MARHCKYGPYVSDYVDGELSAGDADQLLLHMETCEKCQNLLKSFSAITEEMRAVADIEPSTDFNRRFWRTLDARREKGFLISFEWLFSGWKPALSAAAIIMIVCGTLVLRDNRFPHQKTPSGTPAYDLAMAKNLDLFENYDMIENLFLLEHFDEISASTSNSRGNS